MTHAERFPDGSPDEVWLREAGRHGWLVLSKDAYIRYGSQSAPPPADHPRREEESHPDGSLRPV